MTAKWAKTNTRPDGLHGISPYVGLYVAIATLFNLVAIGSYTHVWIPVCIGIAVYIPGVILLFRKLQSEFFGIRFQYSDDEGIQFNRRARYFMLGTVWVELLTMLIFVFIRHQV